MLKRKDKKIPEFNTTALPDIIFMLLFFFMVVTVMKKDNESLIVNIPSVPYAEQLKKHENFLFISANINELGQVSYHIDKQVFTDFDKFASVLFKKSQITNHENLLKAKIKIDKNITMQTVNKIKRALQDTKIYNVEYIINKSL